MSDNLRFVVEDSLVSIYGYPELEGRKGTLLGEGIAFFFGEGWCNHEVYMVNIHTGKVRKLSTSDGQMLVKDDEVDYEAIAQMCEHGVSNAKAKKIRYAGINLWDQFMDGFCAVSWMLYPAGIYFADCDGFGMEDNDEEMVYAIIDSNLDIVAPFQPMEDVGKYLEEVRMKYCENKKRI